MTLGDPRSGQSIAIGDCVWGVTQRAGAVLSCELLTSWHLLTHVRQAETGRGRLQESRAARSWLKESATGHLHGHVAGRCMVGVVHLVDGRRRAALHVGWAVVQVLALLTGCHCCCCWWWCTEGLYRAALLGVRGQRLTDGWARLAATAAATDVTSHQIVIVTATIAQPLVRHVWWRQTGAGVRMTTGLLGWSQATVGAGGVAVWRVWLGRWRRWRSLCLYMFPVGLVCNDTVRNKCEL